MSLADNKRSIFTTIGSYTSLMKQSDKIRQTDLFPSINNKKDIVPFLLDVLKTVVGTEALKEAIGGMFGKLIDDIEPQLKTVLKKQFIQSNSDDLLPTATSITIPVKDIDVNGKLKIDPTSDEGGLVFDNSKPNFDKTAYDAISNSGTEKTFSVLSVTHDSILDNFEVKSSLASNVTIGSFFTTFIDDAEIINKKEITANVMDALYGTLAKKQGKTIEQNYEELKVRKLLEQVLNDDDSFIIPPEDLDGLLVKANELSEGILNYDMGCGLMEAELNFDDLDNMVNNVFGSTDPLFIGNQFESTILKSTSGSTVTQEATQQNMQTIKDNFFQKIINVFTLALLSAVTTAPQIRVLLGMMSALQNGGVVKLAKASEDMDNFKTCIKCMSKEIMRLVAKFIFDLAVLYLIKLIKPVITKVVKEKINQYVGIIKSLTGANKII